MPCPEAGTNAESESTTVSCLRLAPPAPLISMAFCVFRIGSCSNRPMTFLHLVTPCYTTAMAAICSSCGQVNLDEARFCSICGHAIAIAHRASVASPSPTVFVGRQRELQALRAHLDGAEAGVGSLAMLVGEAGIGKTSTARAFAAFVRKRGLMVLWGSCFEGEWSPPMDPGLRRLASMLVPARQSACNANLGQGHHPLSNSSHRCVPSSPTHHSPHPCLLTKNACASTRQSAS